MRNFQHFHGMKSGVWGSTGVIPPGIEAMWLAVSLLVSSCSYPLFTCVRGHKSPPSSPRWRQKRGTKDGVTLAWFTKPALACLHIFKETEQINSMSGSFSRTLRANLIPTRHTFVAEARWRVQGRRCFKVCEWGKAGLLCEVHWAVEWEVLQKCSPSIFSLGLAPRTPHVPVNHTAGCFLSGLEWCFLTYITLWNEKK